MKISLIALVALSSLPAWAASSQTLNLTCFANQNGTNQEVAQIVVTSDGESNSAQVGSLAFRTPGPMPCTINQDGTPQELECHSNILVPSAERVSISVWNSGGILNIGTVTFGDGEEIKLSCSADSSQ